MRRYRSMVLVSSDPESQRLGSPAILQRFQDLLRGYQLEDEVSTGQMADVARSDIRPFAIVYPEAVTYGPLKLTDVGRIVEEHLFKGRVVEELLAPTSELTGRVAWLNTRKGTLPAEARIVLERVGLVDPTNVEDYVLHEGYTALGKVLSEMTPSEVIQCVTDSGLRGRGGAGFPAGTKWGFVAKAAGSRKYIICNADESEPGTFKDRVILEGDPFAILEAMTIAGYAVGADEGYIYIRGEYALAQERINRAILQAREMGFLGKEIFGTAFNFDVHVHSGAGAYICGEETALIESIEGKRGEPRTRPPYPTTNGLWDKPTLVNNVETLANIPPIIRHGAGWYRSFGTPSSPGTKVYTILGNINNSGLIEVPFGITLREVISIYAGGMKDGRTFKLAQTGGSSGSVIPAILQDTPMDFDAYAKAGVSLGSGALLICDDDTCVVDLAKVLLNFFRRESCGKCTPCRVGTTRTYEIMQRISEGEGTLQDLDELLLLSDNLASLSNCGLGQTSGTPIRDLMKYFRAEVEAHIRLKVCPSGVCPMHPELVQA